MLSVVVKKRTVLLIALGLAGLTLLAFCCRAFVGGKDAAPSGLEVSRPAAESLSFKDESRQTAGSTETGAGEAEGPDFFVEYRLNRERARGQRVEYLREVINNAHSAGETRQKAQEHLMAISRNMEKEFELENLIKAKGFKDAAVLVDDRAVTVIVATASLPAEESQLIKELVSKGTGVELQNIVVIHKYQ
ncbi:hypothetical protein PTH_1173 [Pelotomaculum thermopropionicum SI]|uniref:Stage III sporulation protein AH n=1 Tax=Pelotomaculum thermopropionicum (strain DSM 13744 / JCM 10971 / SI) TaxID=370438 RepID=A5D313_PELTS|nr:hypothetical protein PTH_1173 [Pelotomaculum thermopropionicum SI]